MLTLKLARHIIGTGEASLVFARNSEDFRRVIAIFITTTERGTILIRFQRLRISELPLLHRWLNTDHVVEWFGKRQCSFEEVVRKYTPRIEGNDPTSSFLILYADLPIGYIQTYKIKDYPEYSKYVDVAEESAGVDLFIGEAEYLHKGLGSTILAEFLREIVFGSGDAASCIIGPEPANNIAIRAYEKAGFRYLKTIQIPNEDAPEYLMGIERNRVEEEA